MLKSSCNTNIWVLYVLKRDISRQTEVKSTLTRVFEGLRGSGCVFEGVSKKCHLKEKSS